MYVCIILYGINGKYHYSIPISLIYIEEHLPSDGDINEAGCDSGRY